jgi:hypothetical protein
MKAPQLGRIIVDYGDESISFGGVTETAESHPRRLQTIYHRPLEGRRILIVDYGLDTIQMLKFVLEYKRGHSLRKGQRFGGVSEELRMSNSGCVLQISLCPASWAMH